MQRLRSLRQLRFLVAFAPCVAGLGHAVRADELIQLGANAPGVVSVIHSGSVYSLRFTGDEVLEYRIDLNDTYVSVGRVHVYEASSDCWPMDASWGYRDDTGVMHASGWLSGYATLTGQSTTANSVVLDYTDTFSGTNVRHRRNTYTLRGKMLSVRMQDLDQKTNYPDNYIGVLQQPLIGFDAPQALKLVGALATPIIHYRNGTKHYYFNSILDFYNTNAADYGQNQLPVNPTPTTTSLDYVTSTWNMYPQLSDPSKQCAFVDDTFNLTVSSKVQETFVTPTHAPSPYRSLLTDRMVLLLGGTDWSAYQALWNQLDTWGIDNIAGYCFGSWSAAAPDAPAASNLGPDWWPAVNPSSFASMLQQGVAKGFLLGAYGAYNLLPPSAPPAVNDPTHVARYANGAPKLSVQTGLPSMSSTASGIHALSEGGLLHANASANLGYLDVQTYGSPTRGADANHVDEIATSPWAKTMRTAIADQQQWMRALQDLYQGPLLGEGSINGYGSNYEFLWAGSCDSTQRVINTGTGLSNLTLPNTRRGKALSPTGWPVVPEIDWRIFSRLQVNHGNGFPDRFFSPPDGPGMVTAAGLPIYPMTESALDRYRIFELTYGKAAFAQTNGLTGPAGAYELNPDFVKEYFMTNALQSRYTEAAPTTIEYMFQGNLGTFQSILETTNSFEPFRDAQLKLQFPNGLTMWLNHKSVPWTVVAGGVTYVVPEDGFVAQQPSSGFLAFSAIPPGTGGQRIDYCLAPESYEFFDGRGQVGGWGGQSTPTNGVSWTAFSRGRTFRETTNSAIVQVGSSSPPALLRVEVRPPLIDLALGARVGLKAFAVYANGAQRNVTKLVNWSTAQPATASVNNGAALTGVANGLTSVNVSSYQGAPVVPATVTVH